VLDGLAGQIPYIIFREDHWLLIEYNTRSCKALDGRQLWFERLGGIVSP